MTAGLGLPVAVQDSSVALFSTTFTLEVAKGAIVGLTKRRETPVKTFVPHMGVILIQ